MQEINIVLRDMQSIREFVQAVVLLDYDVDLVQGRYIVDAKSIMGIFSLNLSQPIELVIHSDNDEACDKFIAKIS